MGVVTLGAQTDRTRVDRHGQMLTGSGFVSEAFPRAAHGDFAAGLGGYACAALVGLKRGDVVTRLHCFIGANGSLQTLVKLGLYAKSGARLAVTADVKSSFASGSPQMISAALQSAYTVPEDDAYYVVLLQVGGTAATISRKSVAAGQTSPAGSGVPQGAVISGQTDLPATLALSANISANNFWLAAS